MHDNYLNMLVNHLGDKHILALSPLEIEQVFGELAIYYPVTTYLQIKKAYRLELEDYLTQGVISNEQMKLLLSKLPAPKSIIPAGKPYGSLDRVYKKLWSDGPKARNAFILLLSGATANAMANITGVERQDGLYVMMNEEIYYSPFGILYPNRFETKHAVHYQFSKHNLSFVRARATVFKMLTAKLNNQTVCHWYHIGGSAAKSNILPWQDVKLTVDRLFKNYYSR